MFSSIIALFLLLMAQCYDAAFTPWASGCGGYYSAMTEGEITSPGYPVSDYGSNLNCTYIVTAPPDFVITYKSIFMALEAPDDITYLCVYDKVTVYDNDVEMSTYCGDQKIYPTATTTNILKISFITDFEVEFEGFSIKWSILNVNKRPIELNCNFDDSIPLCAGWTNLNKDYPWHFTRGYTPSPNTGPGRDHTTDTQDGRYAYIEGSRAERNATAILVSPVIFRNNFSNQRCLRFWYHMFGSGIGGLSVALNDTNGETKIAEFNRDKGDDWLKAEYTFPYLGMSGTVIFRGRRGTNYMSDIAIDDIDISVGSCDGECAGNMEKAACPSECNLTCDNMQELMSATCTRACFNGCACPVDAPIFDQGICIDTNNCTVDFSITETTKSNIVATERVTDTKSETTPMIPATNVQERIKTAVEKLFEEFNRVLRNFLNLRKK